MAHDLAISDAWPPSSHPDGAVVAIGQGFVKNIHATFGFIRANDGTDLFFLPTYVDGPDGTFKALQRFQRVRFAIIAHRRGQRAVAIQALAGEPDAAVT